MLHRYGITLIAVRRENSDDILLNPGRRFILRLDDMCYYLSIAREENSKFVTEQGALPHVKPALRRTLAFAATFALDLTLQSKTADSSKQGDTETDGAVSHPHGGEGLQSYCQYHRKDVDDPPRPPDEVTKGIRRLRAVATGKGSGSGKKHQTKKEEEHFEGGKASSERQGTGVLSSLITATLSFGLTAMPTAMNRAEANETGILEEETIEIDRVSHTDSSDHSPRDFHGMDALAVKAEGQRKKRGFLPLPSHPAVYHGSITSLSSRATPDRESGRMSKGSTRRSSLVQRPSHGSSQSTLAQAPSVVAPVVLDDVIEESELSDEERDELEELEVGSISDSSGIVEDALPDPEPGVPWVSPVE